MKDFSFEKYPQVKRALVSLAYENGMIDRLNSIETQLSAWEKEILNQPIERVLATESFVATLTDEDLERLTGGEVEDDQAVILKRTKDGDIADLINQFLTDMFEVVPYTEEELNKFRS